MKKINLFLIATFFLISCSKDDSSTPSMGITASDFTANIDENPSQNQIIGAIDASTPNGNLIFEIVSETPNNSIDLNTNTGELSVQAPSVFDFELHQMIQANVLIRNNEIEENIAVTISINNVEEPCDNPDNSSENLFTFLENNPQYFSYNYWDLDVHEFDFILSEDKSLCQIGYQNTSATNNDPFLIELIDANENVIFSENLIFSNLSLEYVAINPIQLLANQSYTIRRTRLYSAGTVLFEGNLDTLITLPLSLNGFTITDSNFYPQGNPFDPSFNAGIPYIGLSFSSN